MPSHRKENEGGVLRRMFVVALISCLAIVPLGTIAYAAGSDSPTPYAVTKDGIQLPAGDTFSDNGHVNIKATGSTWKDLHFEGKCINRTDAECVGDRHAAAQYIGKSFIPWEAFGLKVPFCITWVQLAQYPQHFGEGGQKPVCVGDNTPPEPPTKPEPIVKQLSDERKTCEDGVEARKGTETINWILNDAKTAWVKTEAVTKWGDWNFVRALTDAEKVKLGCVAPEPPKPELIVEKKHEGGAPNCDLKTVTITFYERTTDWTFDKSKNEWIKGEPSEWKVVKTETRDATEQECPKPEEPPTKIDFPKPAFEDPCGPNNAKWKDQVDTDVLTWKVDEQGNLIATIIKDKVVFNDRTTIHNYGKVPESGELCPPVIVINPTASVEVLCDGTGTATLDNSKSTTSVGFEVVKNGEVTLYSVAAGKVETKAFSGAKSGSQVIVHDAEANKLASATVPDKCSTPPVVVTPKCPDGVKWNDEDKDGVLDTGECQSIGTPISFELPPKKSTPPVTSTPPAHSVLPNTGGAPLWVPMTAIGLLLFGSGMVAGTRRKKSVA